MKKIIKYLLHPKMIILYLMNTGYFKFISDKAYLKIKYRLVMGKKLNLEDPQTFNEKLQWLKFYDRKDVYTRLVDKYLVKDYVSELIGSSYVIKTYGVYNSFNEINFNDLPERFVLKPTHTSGDVFICKDKNQIDYRELYKKVNKWLKRRYYWVHREWPYKNVKPRIIAEEYIKNNSVGGELTDYKVMCFNGKPKMIFTCTDRYSDGLKVTFFDLNWHRLPFNRHYPQSTKKISKPKNLKKMIELSEKMAKGFKFVRMDWYEANGNLYFGEYTFYPGSGFEEFEPEIWDKKLGDLLNLSDRED